MTDNDALVEYMSRSVREHLESEVDRFEILIKDFPEDLAAEYRQRSWPHRVLKDWDDRERDHEYQLGRAGILSSAVGLARMALADGDPGKAESILAEAARDCRGLLDAALEAAGIDSSLRRQIDELPS